jgi:hypothetical protein
MCWVIVLFESVNHVVDLILTLLIVHCHTGLGSTVHHISRQWLCLLFEPCTSVPIHIQRQPEWWTAQIWSCCRCIKGNFSGSGESLFVCCNMCSVHGLLHVNQLCYIKFEVLQGCCWRSKSSGRLLDHEDEGIILLWNTGNHLPVNVVQHIWRLGASDVLYFSTYTGKVCVIINFFL